MIGTGCTGIQVVPEVAEEASKVWVFQRTPNYAIPTQNRPLDAESTQNVKDDYEAIWQKARESGFGFPYDVADRSAVDYPAEERERIYEAAWAKGGFYIGIETFSDFLTNKASNDTISDFLRSKIRETVHDPATADLLTPTDLPLPHQTPTPGNGLLRGVQPGQCGPDRRPHHADHGRSRSTASRRLMRSTKPTPSSSRPVSTR